MIRYSQRSGRWRAWAAWHTRWKEGKRQREVLHCLYPGRGRKAVRQLPTMPLWSRIGCHPPSPKTHTFAYTHKHSNKAECLTQQTAGLTAITHVCLLARSLFFSSDFLLLSVSEAVCVTVFTTWSQTLRASEYPALNGSYCLNPNICLLVCLYFRLNEWKQHSLPQVLQLWTG